MGFWECLSTADRQQRFLHLMFWCVLFYSELHSVFFFYLICSKWTSLSTLETGSFNLKPEFSQKPEEQTLVEEIPFDRKTPWARRGTEAQTTRCSSPAPLRPGGPDATWTRV